MTAVNDNCRITFHVVVVFVFRCNKMFVVSPSESTRKTLHYYDNYVRRTLVTKELRTNERFNGD